MGSTMFDMDTACFESLAISFSSGEDGITSRDVCGSRYITSFLREDHLTEYEHAAEVFPIQYFVSL